MIKTYFHNRRPHVVPIGATFFITFRLGDSLPRHIVRELEKEMNANIKILEKTRPPGYKKLIAQQKQIFFKNYEHQLDHKPFGECYLKIPAIAKIIIDKLFELDGEKYELLAYCIMPNHVHLLIDSSIQLNNENDFLKEIDSENYTQLFQIMKLIKGNTAFYSNKHLNRKGKFWQKDSFDHFIRNEKSFWNIVNYILNNPVAAGLVEKWQDHPYTYINPKLIH